MNKYFRFFSGLRSLRVRSGAGDRGVPVVQGGCQGGHEGDRRRRGLRVDEEPARREEALLGEHPCGHRGRPDAQDQPLGSPGGKYIFLGGQNLK